MRKFLTAAVALSVLASAGVASAQPYRGDDRRDHAERHYDKRMDKAERKYDRDVRKAERKYRAPWHPWSTAFVIVLSLAFLGGALWTDTTNVVWSLLLLGAAYPVYYGLNRLGLVGRR